MDVQDEQPGSPTQLWREKGIRIHNEYKKVTIMPMGVLIEGENDPEKSIADAIEYLATNKLLK